MKTISSKAFWAAFGPGVLFAGAAIGNSHLVQSTRAGALFGLGLLSAVIIANLVKYPAYRFGSLYAAATGYSLIHGYRNLGKPVLLIFTLSELFVQAIIIAASALTTAAVSTALFGLPMDARHLAIALTLIGAVILLAGKFSLLDQLCKVFVAILTVSTLIATITVLPRIDWQLASFFAVEMDWKTFAFVVALMGFMPAGLSLSVLQSLWVVAKSRQSGVHSKVPEVILDLNIGYIGSAVLAVCFLLMGAAVMHSEGITPASGAAPFAKQVLDLYAASLGDWSVFLVGVSVLLVIFTTLLTVLDGFPRMLASCYIALTANNGPIDRPVDSTPAYYLMMGLLIAASAALLLFFMSGFTSFIDFVTITSFVVAPIVALLNHLVVHSDAVPVELRPGTAMRCWSIFGFLFLLTVTLIYLGSRVLQ